MELNAIPRLLTLLTHENTDITMDTIGLLQELTDEDVIPEEEEDYERAMAGMERFVQGLVDNQMLELLVQNLSRLEDGGNQEDAKGVFASLGECVCVGSV